MKFKKLLAILFSVLLSISMFAACGSSGLRYSAANAAEISCQPLLDIKSQTQILLKDTFHFGQSILEAFN